MAEGTQLIRGLEGVVAAETELCDLDGTNGRLAYRGYDIADLAGEATFEEVAYLLWMGELPRQDELDRFLAELAAARPIPGELVKAYALMPKQTDPNRVLQASVHTDAVRLSFHLHNTEADVDAVARALGC